MSFFYEVRHDGLNKYQIVRGRTQAEASAKAQAKLNAWNDQYAKMQEREMRRVASESRRIDLDMNKEEANSRTEEAANSIDEIESFLKNVLISTKPFDIEVLKRRDKFKKAKPASPKYKDFDSEPNPEDEKYIVKLNLLDRLIHKWAEKKKKAAQTLFDEDHKEWEIQCQNIHNYNSQLHAETLLLLEKWGSEKEEFEADQIAHNNKIDGVIDKFAQGRKSNVEEILTLALSELDLPDCFPGDFELSFQEESRMLLLDFALPELVNLPNLKSVKYISTRREFSETFHRSNFMEALYDNLTYQVALAMIYCALLHDQSKVVKSVIFNGWVTYTNKASGHETTACILSVQASREQMESISLANVDPKACFKSLKGIGAPLLHEMIPVKPILRLDREDDRFVPSQDVAKNIGEGTNLAAIGWEEFEHLIREVFEKEFSSGGGEVKVTQASNDGGVDAIAFDPDPIRGGKIIIQAKRYTNTVGVSAVRDLYGTIMSEGASKGILVTTSQFGPDAYNFAKDKPITLMDGGNLLYLMERHGHPARIDLAEAKLLGNPLKR